VVAFREGVNQNSLGEGAGGTVGNAAKRFHKGLKRGSGSAAALAASRRLEATLPCRPAKKTDGRRRSLKPRDSFCLREKGRYEEKYQGPTEQNVTEVDLRCACLKKEESRERVTTNSRGEPAWAKRTGAAAGGRQKQGKNKRPGSGGSDVHAAGEITRDHDPRAGDRNL